MLHDRERETFELNGTSLDPWEVLHTRPLSQRRVGGPMIGHEHFAFLYVWLEDYFAYITLAQAPRWPGGAGIFSSNMIIFRV